MLYAHIIVTMAAKVNVVTHGNKVVKEGGKMFLTRKNFTLEVNLRHTVKPALCIKSLPSFSVCACFLPVRC